MSETALVMFLLGSGSQVFAQANPLRNAYFGETQVYTTYSADLFGNRLTMPGDAYRYFKGAPIKHPLGYDALHDGRLGRRNLADRRRWIVGESQDADIFGVVGDAREIKRRVDPHAPEDIQKVYLNVLNMVTGPPVKALRAPGSRRSKRDGQFSYDPHVNAEFALVRIFPNSEGG
jgi:uncharacterized protein DUF3604